MTLTHIMAFGEDRLFEFYGLFSVRQRKGSLRHVFGYLTQNVRTLDEAGKISTDMELSTFRKLFTSFGKLPTSPTDSFPVIVEAIRR
jgi:hypothetical protein